MDLNLQGRRRVNGERRDERDMTEKQRTRHSQEAMLCLSPVFLAFPPPPPLLLFALKLPCRLAATAGVLSGMVNSYLLLLLTGGEV
jgi:hypothetical protein